MDKHTIELTLTTEEIAWLRVVITPEHHAEDQRIYADEVSAQLEEQTAYEG